MRDNFICHSSFYTTHIGLFYFWGFNAYIIVDFVKRGGGALTSVGEIGAIEMTAMMMMMIMAIPLYFTEILFIYYFIFCIIKNK